MNALKKVVGIKVESAPRVFEATLKEVGKISVGSSVSLCVSGKVQSVHDDGRVYVKILSVEKESESSEDKDSKSDLKS